MNTRPVLDSDKGPFALSASFNADNSWFSVALESGFRGMPDSCGLARSYLRTQSSPQDLAISASPVKPAVV